MLHTTRHPSKTELTEYAESLTAAHAPISAVVAAHVNGCMECRAEVNAIRQTLACVEAAGDVEPTRESVARLMLTAKNVRRRAAARERWLGPVRNHAKPIAAAAGLLLAVAIFWSAMEPGAPEQDAVAEDATAPKPTQQTRSNTVLAVERVKPASTEEKRLSSAVFTPRQSPATPRNDWERLQRRAVSQYEQEISTALEALKRNPACLRAASLVNENRDRKTEILRALYLNMEKTL